MRRVKGREEDNTGGVAHRLVMASGGKGGEKRGRERRRRGRA